MSQLENDLVTVVSPCYNHAKYVVESLNSIKNQTYQNIEHIIIDDCSSDNSVFLIQQWIKENSYNCKFIIHKKNMGLSNTLNESIDMAKGKYWSVIATDDVMMPERTKTFVDYLKENNEVSVIVSDCIFIDEDSNKILKEGTSSAFKLYTKIFNSFNVENFGTYQSLLTQNYIPSSYLFKKEVLIKVGKYNPDLSVEDWDIFLRISKNDLIKYIDLPLTYYRTHSHNTINNASKMEESVGRMFLLEYNYCKKNNCLNLYYKARTKNLLFSPIRHPKLSWELMKTMPLHLYMSGILNKISRKIFKN